MGEYFRTKGSLRKLERWTRLATARKFTNRRVELQRSYLVEPELITGQVHAVARTLGGSGDVVVLTVERWVRDGEDVTTLRDEVVAISLAQVDWIRTLMPGREW